MVDQAATPVTTWRASLDQRVSFSHCGATTHRGTCIHHTATSLPRQLCNALLAVLVSHILPQPLPSCNGSPSCSNGVPLPTTPCQSHHNTPRQRLRRIRDALLDALRTTTPPPAAQLDALVDALVCDNQPFKPSDIGEGAWQVVYTRGPLLWRTLAPPGRLIDPLNEFSQAFDWQRGTLLNRGTLLGGAVALTAQGRYHASGPTLPLRIRATVSSGALQVGALRVPLPIQGRGEVDLVYADGTVRVFRQPNGGLAVQVERETLLNCQQS